jgi:hypothetical protein
VKVVKVSYARSASAAKGSARYYSHRPSASGEREWRDGFSRDEDWVDRRAVYERVDGWEADGCRYYYRVVLAPGEGREPGVPLHEWTREVMDRFQERGLSRDWVAWEHRDHSQHAHVHVLAAADRKWTREDLAWAREVAGREWDHVRDRYWDRDRDLERDRDREREIEREEDRDRWR